MTAEHEFEDDEDFEDEEDEEEPCVDGCQGAHNVYGDCIVDHKSWCRDPSSSDVHDGDGNCEPPDHVTWCHGDHDEWTGECRLVLLEVGGAKFVWLEGVVAEAVNLHVGDPDEAFDPSALDALIGILRQVGPVLETSIRDDVQRYQT